MDQYKQINQELVESNSDLKGQIAVYQRELNKTQGELMDQRRLYVELQAHVQYILRRQFKMLHSALVEMNPGANVLRMLGIDDAGNSVGGESRRSNLGSNTYISRSSAAANERRSSRIFQELHHRRSNVQISPIRRRSSGSSGCLVDETEAAAAATIVSSSVEIPRYIEENEAAELAEETLAQLNSICEMDERDEEELEKLEGMLQQEEERMQQEEVEESERMQQEEVEEPERMQQKNVEEPEKIEQAEVQHAEKHSGITQRRGKKLQKEAHSVPSQVESFQSQADSAQNEAKTTRSKAKKTRSQAHSVQSQVKTARSEALSMKRKAKSTQSQPQSEKIQSPESSPSPPQHNKLRSKRRNILIYRSSPLQDITNHNVSISPTAAAAVVSTENNSSSDSEIVRKRPRKIRVFEDLSDSQSLTSKVHKDLSDIGSGASKDHKEMNAVEPARRSTRQNNIERFEKDKTIASTCITSVNSTHKDLTANDSVSTALSELTICNFIEATSSTPRDVSNTKNASERPSQNTSSRPIRRCAPKILTEPTLTKKMRNETESKPRKKK